MHFCQDKNHNIKKKLQHRKRFSFKSVSHKSSCIRLSAELTGQKKKKLSSEPALRIKSTSTTFHISPSDKEMKKSKIKAQALAA